MANVINSSLDYSPCHQIWESMAAGIALPTHQLPGIHHKNKWERRKTFQLGLFFSAHFVSCDTIGLKPSKKAMLTRKPRDPLVFSSEVLGLLLHFITQSIFVCSGIQFLYRRRWNNWAMSLHHTSSTDYNLWICKSKRQGIFHQLCLGFRFSPQENSFWP